MARTEYLLHKQLDLVLASLMPANRRACEVSLHTGLRISDVLALETEPLRRSSRFWVHEAKTGKAKYIGIPAPLRVELLAHAGEKWVFPSRNDPEKHRTRQAVWADVKRAEWAFRLPQNIGPHSMRKDYAVDLMRKYGDIRRVQRALNHSDAATTALYALADHLLESGRVHETCTSSKSTCS